MFTKVSVPLIVVSQLGNFMLQVWHQQVVLCSKTMLFVIMSCCLSAFIFIVCILSSVWAGSLSVVSNRIVHNHTGNSWDCTHDCPQGNPAFNLHCQMSLSHTSKMACSNEYAADLVTQYPDLIMWESFSKLQKCFNCRIHFGWYKNLSSC